MKEQEINYSTIEHDYMQLKDTFDNQKFAYIEKITKQYFIEGLKTHDYERDNVMGMVSASKVQLRDVKALISEQEELIKSISCEIYDLENLNKEYENEINILMRQKDEEIKKYDDFTEKLGNVKIMGELHEKVNKNNEEISETMRIIENKNEQIKKLDINKMEKELSVLQTQKEELCEQERNLSRIFFDDSVQELYEWYLNGTLFLNKLYQIEMKEIKSLENGNIELHLFVLNTNIIVYLENKRFIGAKAFYLEHNQDLFDELISDCVFVNDIRLFLYKLPFIIQENIK